MIYKLLLIQILIFHFLNDNLFLLFIKDVSENYGFRNDI